MPTGTRGYRSSTSATCIRMQPCDAREPIDQSSEVPWMPTPSAIPSQRALSGLFGAPPGMTWPWRLPAHAEFGHVPRRVHLLVGDRVHARRRVVAGLPDGDRIGLRELQALEDAQAEVVAVDREDRPVDLGEVVRVDLGRDALRALRAQDARGARLIERRVDLRRQRRGVDLRAGLRARAVDVADGDADRRVARLLARLRRHRLGERADRQLRVAQHEADVGGLPRGQLAAGVERAARGLRRVEGELRVGCLEPQRPAGRVDDDVALQLLREERVEAVLRDRQRRPGQVDARRR